MKFLNNNKMACFYKLHNFFSKAVIIARYSGSTSVCSTLNLKNLLGISPEFLAGQPQICELGSEKGFLCLDCETFVTSKKRSREPNDTRLSGLFIVYLLLFTCNMHDVYYILIYI